MKLRIFMILCCLPLSVAAAFGQATPEKAPNPATEIRKGFEEVNGWVTAAAEMVPADKYNYRPADSVRTFGQLIAHITDSYNYFCAHAVGNKVEWLTPIEKAPPTKTRSYQNSKKQSDDATPPTVLTMRSFDRCSQTWAIRACITATSSSTCACSVSNRHQARLVFVRYNSWS